MDLKIVDELQKVLEQNSATYAMWIAGSVAEGYADKLSDVDLWLDIEDGQELAVFSAIEQFLLTRGTIDINFSEEDMSPPFMHKVYHLAHMDQYHFIEVTLHSHSHKYEFIEGVRIIKILFDKDNTIQFKPLDTIAHAQMLQSRQKFLIEKIALGELAVTKEITRGQFMDALHNYQFWLVEPVIELARIKYAPLKISYGLKHGSRDLPKTVVTDIESLYVIASLEHLRDKIIAVKTMVKKYI